MINLRKTFSPVTKKRPQNNQYVALYLSFKFLLGRITLAKTLTYGFEIEDNKKNVYGKQVYL